MGIVEDYEHALAPDHPKKSWWPVLLGLVLIFVIGLIVQYHPF